MKRIVIAFSGILVICLSISQSALADRRSYVWTYEYMTMPKGMSEIEYYLTEEQPDIETAKPNTWKHYIELEYGITDHWDVAVYQRLKQSNKKDESELEYDGFKLRTRYKIAEKNKLPIDTLLYLEYIRDDDFDNPNVLEGKVILAKDLGGLNLSYNQIIKQVLEPDGETEYEYAAGLSYAVRPTFRIGIESKGNYTEGKYYVGPTVAWTPGRFWTALGVAAGLNGESDDIQTRLIVGVPF